MIRKPEIIRILQREGVVCKVVITRLQEKTRLLEDQLGWSTVHRRKLAQAIYLNLIGAGRAVDMVVVTPEDLERYCNTPGLVIAPALRDGNTVYENTAGSRLCVA